MIMTLTGLKRSLKSFTHTSKLSLKSLVRTLNSNQLSIFLKVTAGLFMMVVELIITPVLSWVKSAMRLTKTPWVISRMRLSRYCCQR